VTIAPEVEDLDKVRQHARLVTIKECGHFAYLEGAGAVRIVFENYFVSERRANAVGSQSGRVDCRPHQNRR
jgi:hypothetical protein